MSECNHGKRRTLNRTTGRCLAARTPERLFRRLGVRLRPDPWYVRRTVRRRGLDRRGDPVEVESYVIKITAVK